MYHYAGNNPVKYTDPDGRTSWLAASLIIGGCLLLKSDQQPRAKPVDSVAINNKLSNIFYDDPAKKIGLSLSSPYTHENSKSLTLESHPLLAIACALPRGGYAETDYSDSNQMKGRAVEKVGTSIDGLSLVGTVLENLSEGHVGDIVLTYKKSGGTITSWALSLTTLDPITGKSTARQVFSREDALKYLNDNKEILKNDPAYKELKILLD